MGEKEAYSCLLIQVYLTHLSPKCPRSQKVVASLFPMTSAQGNSYFLLYFILSTFWTNKILPHLVHIDQNSILLIESGWNPLSSLELTNVSIWGKKQNQRQWYFRRFFIGVVDFIKDQAILIYFRGTEKKTVEEKKPFIMTLPYGCGVIRFVQISCVC